MDCGRNLAYRSGLCETCYGKTLERARARRLRLREQGLCVACGRPAERRVDGSFYTRCRWCRLKYRLL